MGIAFFDLDKTLLSVNSGALWVRAEHRERRIGHGMMLRASFWIGLYHLGVLEDLDPILRESVRTLRGEREDAIRERTRRFYEREVRGRVRPGAWDALRREREAGASLVLLTTSSNYVSELAVGELGLDDFVSTRFLTDPGGRFTGEPDEPICAGKGKVERAAAYALDRGISLRDCAFYTDSASDVPMLEAVGRPVAVNPDPKLRRTAQRRGWEIDDWGGGRG